MLYQIDPTTSTIIAGPFEITDPEIKRITGCGNPDRLDLSHWHIYEARQTSDDAPLGWQAPYIEHDDHGHSIILKPYGTQAERLEATLGILRLEAHQARTAEREARQTASFPSQGFIFAADHESRSLLQTVITGALTAIITNNVADAEALIGAGWRDIYSVPRLTTIPEALQLQADYNAHIASIDAASQAIAAAIDREISPAALQALIDNIGSLPAWPALVPS